MTASMDVNEAVSFLLAIHATRILAFELGGTDYRCATEVPPPPCRVLGRVNGRRQRLHMGGHDMTLHGGCQFCELSKRDSP
jgi:hypothetical protein